MKGSIAHGRIFMQLSILGGCLVGKWRRSFARLRRFLLLLFGQKLLDPQPDRFGDGNLVLVAISAQGVVRILIEARFDVVLLGIFRFWPSCSWTQGTHLTFSPTQINYIICPTLSQLKKFQNIEEKHSSKTPVLLSNTTCGRFVNSLLIGAITDLYRLSKNH